jgi:hypothetical protein
MTNPTKTRHRCTAQQNQEAVELCLQEGLSCYAVAQRRLDLPSSSLARWVRQAPINRGQPGPRDQGLLSPLAEHHSVSLAVHGGVDRSVLLGKLEIVCSMSAKGCCGDNCPPTMRVADRQGG